MQTRPVCACAGKEQALNGTMNRRRRRVGRGTVLAQSAETSEHPGMPEAAVATGAVDRVLPLGQIAAAIVEAVTATEAA
jgi:two-component system chemotaxis response regulator CheB